MSWGSSSNKSWRQLQRLLVEFSHTGEQFFLTLGLCLLATLELRPFRTRTGPFNNS